MVHALHEAQRVLKPNGILIDLRPALAHRQVGMGEGKQVRWMGRMREDFADDRAANRAVAEVLGEGISRRESQTQFDLDRVLDSLEDLRQWLDDFSATDELPSHEWLYKRLERAQKRAGERRRITVRGPLMLTVMRKA